MSRRVMISIWAFLLLNAFLLTPVVPKVPGSIDRAWAQNVVLRTIKVEEARDMIASHKGTPVVLLLYRSTCPACRSIFDPFLEAALEWRNKGVFIMAVSVDSKKGKAKTFLYGKNLPFEPLVFQRWRKGQLDQAMAEVGITIGETFNLPFMAVIDANGQVVVDGTGNLGAVDKAVEDLL